MAIMAKATGKPATSLVVWWYVAMPKPGAAHTPLAVWLQKRQRKKKEGATFSVAAAAGAALSRSVFYTAFRR